MPLRSLLLASAVVAAVLVTSPAPADASAADPLECAQTTDPTTPARASAGAPCWTDVEPYPFGFDGAPVDATSPDCRPPNPQGQNYAGDQNRCYLRVDSFAFRAWNRGLASTTPASGEGVTAFGVWLFNGTRWFPDPTFPGQSVCRGDTVLWAGKRDYWLVGTRQDVSWPSICRFDGVNFEWQPLEVPRAALDKVPTEIAQGVQRRRPGSITAGSCSRWDDCVFFGDYGIVLRWNGATLSDASPELAAQPWLATSFRAAATRVDASGAVSSFAVGTSGGENPGEQLPPRPDGSAPAQLFQASAGLLLPLPLTPPSVARPGDPFRTDLAAVAFDRQGRGWLAGNPAGYRAGPGTSRTPVGSRRASTPEPAPVLQLTSDGGAAECSAVPPNRFRFPQSAGSEAGFLWSSIAVLPAGDGSAEALVGGELQPASPGSTNVNDDGQPEPVLVQTGCERSPRTTRFRIPDPFVTDGDLAAAVPTNRGGFLTDVAANAGNDAWAATSRGNLTPRSGAVAPQRPRLYHLRDPLPPDAPTGDDVEARPVFFEPDPPIFREEPPQPDPPQVAVETAVTTVAPTVTRTERLRPAVYLVKSRVETSRVSKRSKRRTYTLVVVFRVRRPVTIGVEALRGTRVVGRSGLKRFRQPSGKLTVRLDRARWPKRIRFVFPKPAPAAPAVAAPPATTRNAPK